MVSALIPPIREGQQGRRETGGIIRFGDVVDTRVDWPSMGDRTYVADVRVIGKGGRAHVIKDCATIVPVRIGDPVIIEMPQGDPRLGSFITGKQVPNRPLMFSANSVATKISDTRYRLARVPYEYLGWPQAHAFDVTATMLLSWNNDRPRGQPNPTPASLAMTIQLEVDSEALGWIPLPNIDYTLIAQTDLGAPTEPATFHWSGIYTVDDYGLDPQTIQQFLRIALYIDAADDGFSVKWLDTSGIPYYRTTTGATLVAEVTANVLVVELGAGTY